MKSTKAALQQAAEPSFAANDSIALAVHYLRTFAEGHPQRVYMRDVLSKSAFIKREYPQECRAGVVLETQIIAMMDKARRLDGNKGKLVNIVQNKLDKVSHPVIVIHKESLVTTLVDQTICKATTRSQYQYNGDCCPL